MSAAVPSRRLRRRAVRPLRQQRAHCRAGVQSACVNAGGTRSGQGEYAVVTQADGSLVKTAGMPHAHLLPSLLTLTDVMATGWHAAVAAGVRPGGTVVVVGDGAVGLCGVIAAVQLGAEKVVVMSRHEPRQQLARAFGATHVVAERDKDAATAVDETPTASGRTRCSSASAPAKRHHGRRRRASRVDRGIRRRGARGGSLGTTDL